MIDALKTDERFISCVTHWHTQPAKAPVYAPYPDFVDVRIRQALEKRGVHALYSHQASSVEAVRDGKDIVVVTPTASGKTITTSRCYQPSSQPTAGAVTFHQGAVRRPVAGCILISLMDVDIKTFTYDGVRRFRRRAIRRPHGGDQRTCCANILPHHTKWVKLFENLRYIVDEIHAYRGVFGSNQ